MASTLQNVVISESHERLSRPLRNRPSNPLKAIYEENRHRVYALSFWMTDSELQAEQLLEATFVRAFASNPMSRPKKRLTTP